jgi:hypothetical protein
MAKKTAAPESSTTQVNIADFQRTRDSVSYLSLHLLPSLSITASPPPSLPTRLVSSPATTSLPLHFLSHHPTMAVPNGHAVDLVDLSPEYRASFIQSTRLVVHAMLLLEGEVDRISTALTTPVSPDKVADSCPQVIVALATLMSSVQDLSRAYINHANTVIAPGRGGALDSNLTSILTESGLLTGPGGAAVAAAVAQAEAPEEGGKKKRKRTPHDPNAPKRALTPYFLYMQSARSQIAKELGDQAKPKEVADEGTRRWTEMPQPEKAVSLPSSYFIIMH